MTTVTFQAVQRKHNPADHPDHQGKVSNKPLTRLYRLPPFFNSTVSMMMRCSYSFVVLTRSGIAHMQKSTDAP